MFIPNLLYFTIREIVIMLFSMLCLCPQHGISPYGKHMENWAKPGCFRSQDQRKSEYYCGSRNWSTAGHKRKTETFVVFTKKNLFLEVLAEVNKFSHLHAHYVAVLFICVGPFQNFNILCIFYPSLIRSRLLHQVKWKFPVHLKLK